MHTRKKSSTHVTRTSRQIFPLIQIRAQLEYEITIISSFDIHIITVIHIHAIPHRQLTGSTVYYIAKGRFGVNLGVIIYDRSKRSSLIDMTKWSEGPSGRWKDDNTTEVPVQVSDRKDADGIWSTASSGFLPRRVSAATISVRREYRVRFFHSSESFLDWNIKPRFFHPLINKSRPSPISMLCHIAA